MDNQPNKTQHNKKALIDALEKSLGVVTSACKSVGLNRSTYYDYYNSDPEFKKSVDELSNIALDFAESNLHKQIKDGNTSATIFYLKTKGKKRGYVERQEITGVEGTKLFEVEILKNDKEDTE
tara:strand:- start:1793 stop:2161 length:369 start_codon:yes stop_codon:yes gene_type:complete